MAKLLNAGDLRHRVAIQERVEVQDPDTGDITHGWATINDGRGNWSSLPAQKAPVSAREFEAAAAAQGQITTRWVLRFVAGVDAKMRLLHNGTPYNLNGPPLEDAESGLAFMTLTTTAGTDAG